MLLGLRIQVHTSNPEVKTAPCCGSTDHLQFGPAVVGLLHATRPEHTIHAEKHTAFLHEWAWILLYAFTNAWYESTNCNEDSAKLSVTGHQWTSGTSEAVALQAREISRLHTDLFSQVRRQILYLKRLALLFWPLVKWFILRDRSFKESWRQF